MEFTDYDQLFPGRFLKAGDFGGKEVVVTIADIEQESMPQEKGGDRDKPILCFVGKKKKLVLNRTNGECVKAMFGRKPMEWIGKRITLYAAEFNGDPCIRIKGSPDLAANVTFELKLPRKKPKATTMYATGKGNGKPPPAVSDEVRDVLEQAQEVGDAP